MATVTSKDGTKISYDQSGEGPALILVLGAFNDRTAGVPLARALQQRFTVFNYDRRGRRESGDSATYAVDREIEDIGALIAQAGGSARVFGYSSGAILALRAAAQGLPISQLALYEPPPTGARAGELAPQLNELIAAGRRGDAVELFQTDAIGIPAEVVAQMRFAPFRPGLEKIAKTLVYESLILKALPKELIASVRIPTLILDGEASPEVMRQAARAVVAAIPHSQYRSLKGQTHEIDPAVVGPVLEGFILLSM